MIWMSCVGMVRVNDVINGINVPDSIVTSAKDGMEIMPVIGGEASPGGGGSSVPSPYGPPSSPKSQKGTSVGSPMVASRKGRLERSGGSSKKMRRECRSSAEKSMDKMDKSIDKSTEKNMDKMTMPTLVMSNARSSSGGLPSSIRETAGIQGEEGKHGSNDALLPTLGSALDTSPAVTDAVVVTTPVIPDGTSDAVAADVAPVATTEVVDVVNSGICGGGAVGGYHIIPPSLRQPHLTINTAFSTSGSISQSTGSSLLESPSPRNNNHNHTVQTVNSSALLIFSSLHHTQHDNQVQTQVIQTPQASPFPNPLAGSPRSPRTPRVITKVPFGTGLPTIQDVPVGKSSAHDSNESSANDPHNKAIDKSVRGGLNSTRIGLNSSRRGCNSSRHGALNSTRYSPTADGVSTKRKGLQDLKNDNARRKVSAFFPTVNFSPFASANVSPPTATTTGTVTPLQRQPSFALRMGHLINFNLSGGSSHNSSKSSLLIGDNDNHPSTASGVGTKGSKEPSYHSQSNSRKSPKTLNINMLMNWRFSKLNVDEQIVIRIAAVAGIYKRC